MKTTFIPDGAALGVLSIRIWLGVRGLLSGIEKFAGYRSQDTLVNIDGEANTWGLTNTVMEKFYAWGNYAGIPEAMRTQFEAEPLLPGFALTVYNIVLGPALLILGLTVLLGIAPRLSLFFTGLLYTSLTVGLVLLNQSAGVAWLGTHLILVAIALLASDKDRYTLAGRRW